MVELQKLLVMLLPVIVIVSGCIVPGTDIELPGVPDIMNFGVQSDTADVIVIKSFTAYPDKVGSGQEINVVAYIQNKGDNTIDSVDVELYDYCTGLFNVINQNQKIPKILPSETRKVEWKLKAKNVELETSCNLKMSATYRTSTNSTTTINFINEAERQRQLEEGTLKSRSSQIVQGKGPVKMLVKTLNEQPIAVSQGSTFSITLEVENKGTGFVTATSAGGKSIQDIKLTRLEYNGNDIISKCKFNTEDNYITLINGKSSKVKCDGIESLNIKKEATAQITAEIDYSYELRKEKKVTVTKYL